MAAGCPPTQFVELTNSHLVCSLCNNVFTEPVINVKCGHTFCKDCILRQTPENNLTKCSVDGITCDLDLLVVNKALQSQIDDLEVYCPNGLVWSPLKDNYVQDPQKCTKVLKYGEKKIHEDVCEFAEVYCPNDDNSCGKFKRKDLTRHLQTCERYFCQHRVKGCDFLGKQHAVANHMSSCGYRGLPSNGADSKKMAGLEKTNDMLQEEVKLLKKRIDALEKAKFTSDAKIETCLNLIKTLQQKQEQMQEKLERQVVKRSVSAVEPRRRSGEIVRTPSGSSFPGFFRTPGPRIETWTMPFQFKCIGTLRGHREPIWALKSRANWLFSAGEDKVIKVWDLEDLTRGCQQTLSGHTDKIHSLAVGDLYLYSGGSDFSIIQWSIHDRTLVRRVEKAHDDIVADMICKDEYLFTSSHQVIKVWDANTLDHIHTMTGLHHWVRSLALNPAKDRLYSGSHNTIEIWSAAGNFDLVGKISHTHGSAHSLAITDAYIVVGTYNKNIHLFDRKTSKYHQKLSGHLGIIMDAVPSLSGRFLFTASSDSAIQIWNLENMLPIMSLKRHEGSVNSLVLHNDLLLSASEDAEIKVFKYFKMQPGFVPS